jgi:hypothetical protein
MKRCSTGSSPSKLKQKGRSFSKISSNLKAKPAGRAIGAVAANFAEGSRSEILADFLVSMLGYGYSSATPE